MATKPWQPSSFSRCLKGGCEKKFWKNESCWTLRIFGLLFVPPLRKYINFHNLSVVSGVRYVELPVYSCQPSVVAVKVPPPAAWPSHVKLWRCMGSVYKIGPFECGVIKEDHFRLNATTTFDNVMFFTGTVPMTNHTACGLQCTMKQKDCDNTTHKLDPQTCQCNCRNDLNCPSGKVRAFINIYLLIL